MAQVLSRIGEGILIAVILAPYILAVLVVIVGIWAVIHYVL